jgi:hypothetical protein
MWADPVHLWADDIVGEWQAGDAEIDLTGHIPASGTYRVRFASQSAAPILADKLALIVDEVPRPGLMRRERGRDDVVLVTAPNPDAAIVLHVVLAGGGGQVLLRRI